MIELSPSGWATLHQLWRERAVEDQYIVSKEGRKELIAMGFAVRTSGMGPRNLAMSNLTPAGRVLARLAHETEGIA